MNRLARTCWFLAAFPALTSIAADVYQITGDVTGGIDLVGGGYQTDRIAGPASGLVTVSGPITHADGLTKENPFYLIGCGGAVRLGTDTTLDGLPLKMTGDTLTQWQWTSSIVLRRGLEIDSNGKLAIGYLDAFSVYGDGSTPADLFLNGGSCVSYGRLEVGNEIGDANLKIANASYEAMDDASYDMYVGWQRSPGRADMKVSVDLQNATVAVRNFQLMNDAIRSDTEGCRVNLGADSLLAVCQTIHNGGGRSRIVFDGGRYVSSKGSYSDVLFQVNGYVSWNGDYPAPWLTLEGANGNPIDIEIGASDRNLVSGLNDRRLIVTGNGGLVKRGAGTLTWNRLGCSYPWDPNLVSVCNYTGDTVIKGGGIKLADADYQPGRGALVLETADSTYDLNGISSALFTGLSGLGTVLNTSVTAATLSLGYANADGEWSAGVASTVPVVKIGTGTLTLKDGAAGYAGDLIVSNGTFKIAAGVAATAFGTVTVCGGATLDIRGATFKCADLRLLAMSKVLSDADTVISFGGAADQSFNNGLVGLAGGFAKCGTGTLSIYGADTLDGRIEVREGVLKVLSGKWKGKYIKVNLQMPCPLSDGICKTVGSFALYDTAGNDVAQTITVFNTTQGGTGEGLAEGEVRHGVSGGGDGFYSYQDGQGPLQLFDGDVNTMFNLWYSWGSEFLILRLPDETGDIVGYNFNSSVWPQYRVVTWNVYGSEDGVTWTLLGNHLCKNWEDESERAKTAAETPDTACTWYNDGQPYCLSALSNATGRAFGEHAVVTVAPGATLDLSDMELSSLAIDCTVGGGTLSHFAAAQNGTIVISNFTETSDELVPFFSAESVANARNLRNWTVMINGEVSQKYRLVFRNGKLALRKVLGITVILR